MSRKQRWLDAIITASQANDVEMPWAIRKSRLAALASDVQKNQPSEA